jgi:hypothetical protein
MVKNPTKSKVWQILMMLIMFSFIATPCVVIFSLLLSR